MTKTTIQVLWSWCPTCKQLHQAVVEITQKNNLQVDVEYITDIIKIAELWLMTTPVIIINSNIVLSGRPPEYQALQDLILQNIKS